MWPWLREPSSRAGITLEELEQQFGDFAAARFARVQVVVRARILFRPHQAVELPRRVAGRPKI